MKKLDINIKRAEVQVVYGNKIGFNFINCVKEDFEIIEEENSIKINQLNVNEIRKSILNSKIRIQKSNLMKIEITINEEVDEIFGRFEDGVIRINEVSISLLDIKMDNGVIKINGISVNDIVLENDNGVTNISHSNIKKSIKALESNGVMNIKNTIKRSDNPTIIAKNGVSRIFGKVKLVQFKKQGVDNIVLVCKNGVLNIND